MDLLKRRQAAEDLIRLSDTMRDLVWAGKVTLRDAAALKAARERYDEASGKPVQKEI